MPEMGPSAVTSCSQADGPLVQTEVQIVMGPGTLGHTFLLAAQYKGLGSTWMWVAKRTSDKSHVRTGDTA